MLTEAQSCRRAKMSSRSSARQLLGIVDHARQPRGSDRLAHDHRGRHHRPGQRPAPGLVDAGDDAVAFALDRKSACVELLPSRLRRGPSCANEPCRARAKVVDILLADAGAMAQLRAVRTLGLPDWCIAGGFVRNRVWDVLTGQRANFHADTDVLFFDPADRSTRTRSRRWNARLGDRCRMSNGRCATRRACTCSMAIRPIAIPRMP